MSGEHCRLVLPSGTGQSWVACWAQVRCVWRVVLPLLDMGYQVDVRVLDSVFYGVPQTRHVSSSSASPAPIASRSPCTDEQQGLCNLLLRALDLLLLQQQFRFSCVVVLWVCLTWGTPYQCSKTAGWCGLPETFLLIDA